jgi:hypothetical protein
MDSLLFRSGKENFVLPERIKWEFKDAEYGIIRDKREQNGLFLIY